MAAAFSTTAQPVDPGADRSTAAPLPALAFQADPSANKTVISLPSPHAQPLVASLIAPNTAAASEEVQPDLQTQTQLSSQSSTADMLATSPDTVPAIVRTHTEDTVSPGITVPVENVPVLALQPVRTSEPGSDSSERVATHLDEQQQSTLTAVAADYAAMMGEQEEQKQASAAAKAGFSESQPENTLTSQLPRLDSTKATGSITSAGHSWEDAPLIPAVLPPAPDRPSNRKAGSALFQKLAGRFSSVKMQK